MPRQSVRLAPLGGQRSQRVSDAVLDGVVMRGGFNVGVRDGEWWCRKGESLVGTDSEIRFGSTPWWWVLDAFDSTTRGVIANPYWALGVFGQSCFSIYAPAISEDLIVENGSAQATSATTRTINQMVLIGAGGSTTDEVYRVTAVNGTALTLERPYEGQSGTKATTEYLDPLPRNAAGTAASYTLASGTPIRGSAVVFEQLVTHADAAIHAGSLATVAGNSYLVITSAFGMPVAINLTAALAGSPAVVNRSWFYNTALASPSLIASDTYTGLYAEVYKNRLFISQAPDPNADYGDKTVWWSQFGDFALWHTGIAGQTAAGNFKTFDGVFNPITEMKCIGDDIVVHRDRSQEIGSATQSLAQPFSFRSNSQGLGIGDRRNNVSNRCVVANGLQYIWTQQGPAIFDGASVRLIARDAVSDLIQYGMIRAPFRLDSAIHDAQLGRIYWIINGVTHQDADATEAKTTRAGTTYTSRCTAWVYDYLNDVSWFEDHPSIYGGGCSETVGGESTPIAVASRFDGTLVKLSAGDVGKDCDLDDPDDVEAVPAAQCDTQWLGFGSNERKTIVKVEVALRSLGGTSTSFDSMTDIISTAAYFRMRIYGDLDESETIADVDDTYDETAATVTTDNRQEQLILLKFTPSKCSARAFKFRFSNMLTDAATEAGYTMAPFRISEVVVYFTQRVSDSANSYANE